MSGPVEVTDAGTSPGATNPSAAPALVVSTSRTTTVGAMAVRRALPNRGRRTVGAWCFVDHAGPITVDGNVRPDVGPHPHMGLQTVTWLIEGELLHRDSLGSEQVLRPGQLNLMTAGHGVAHAEEAATRPGGTVHLVQLWIAQPSATRWGAPAFEHRPELSRLELPHAVVTMLVGELGPTDPDAQVLGADLDLRSGSTTAPLDPAFEHALVVTIGRVMVEGQVATPGHLVYLGRGRAEVTLSVAEPARALLLGGVPFAEQLLMWWNFVARTRQEIEAAHVDWATDSGRFGRVASPLDRIETPPPPWVPPPG
ncbi:MAG TPA: pirin family protein [Acidimicrobiales bacterium]